MLAYSSKMAAEMPKARAEDGFRKFGRRLELIGRPQLGRLVPQLWPPFVLPATTGGMGASSRQLSPTPETKNVCQITVCAKPAD